MTHATTAGCASPVFSWKARGQRNGPLLRVAGQLLRVVLEYAAARTLFARLALTTSSKPRPSTRKKRAIYYTSMHGTAPSWVRPVVPSEQMSGALGLTRNTFFCGGSG